MDPAGPAVSAMKKGRRKRKSRKVPRTQPSIEVENKGMELHATFEKLDISKNDESGTRVVASFEEMGLSSKLLQGIYAYGLEKPASIQGRAIVPMIRGRDVIMQAQSGMGKTAAIVIASLARIDISMKETQVLLLTPTRELAEQIVKVYKEIGRPLGIEVFACVGGTNSKTCKNACASGQHVVVGTPGRLANMMGCHQGSEKYLRSNCIKMFAMDEADKLIDFQFEYDITSILQEIPEVAQVVLMSATMPSSALKKTSRFMRNPLKFLLKKNELTLDGIRQYYINVEREEEKINVLCELWKWEGMKSARGMIFCRTRQGVDTLAKLMMGRGHFVPWTRGDLSQAARGRILKEFRSGQGESKMLITSDLLARGIDVQHVNLVINYDIPEGRWKDEYIHRVGRGGRYGRHGMAITFVTEKEVEQIHEIEKFYGTSIEPLPDLSTLRIE